MPNKLILMMLLVGMLPIATAEADAGSWELHDEYLQGPAVIAVGPQVRIVIGALELTYPLSGGAPVGIYRFVDAQGSGADPYPLSPLFDPITLFTGAHAYFLLDHATGKVIPIDVGKGPGGANPPAVGHLLSGKDVLVMAVPYNAANVRLLGIDSTSGAIRWNKSVSGYHSTIVGAGPGRALVFGREGLILTLVGADGPERSIQESGPIHDVAYSPEQGIIAVLHDTDFRIPHRVVTLLDPELNVVGVGSLADHSAPEVTGPGGSGRMAFFDGGERLAVVSRLGIAKFNVQRGAMVASTHADASADPYVPITQFAPGKLAYSRLVRAEEDDGVGRELVIWDADSGTAVYETRVSDAGVAANGAIVDLDHSTLRSQSGITERAFTEPKQASCPETPIRSGTLRLDAVDAYWIEAAEDFSLGSPYEQPVKTRSIVVARNSSEFVRPTRVDREEIEIIQSSSDGSYWGHRCSLLWQVPREAPMSAGLLVVAALFALAKRRTHR